MQYDFELYTDGSGRDLDGFSGYAALARTADAAVQRFTMGGMTQSTVDRAEFTALIEGLRLCYEMWDRFPHRSLVGGEQDKPRARIHWFSDRENLVLSVKKVYARSNYKDLWAAFEYYEAQFDITAQHVTEPFTDTDPCFKEVDLQSSTARIIFKSYYEETPLHVDIKPKVKSRASKTSGTDTDPKQG